MTRKRARTAGSDAHESFWRLVAQHGACVHPHARGHDGADRCADCGHAMPDMRAHSSLASVGFSTHRNGASEQDFHKTVQGPRARRGGAGGGTHPSAGKQPRRAHVELHTKLIPTLATPQLTGPVMLPSCHSHRRVLPSVQNWYEIVVPS